MTDDTARADLTPKGSVVGPKAAALIATLSQHDDYYGAVLDVIDEAARPSGLLREAAEEAHLFGPDHDRRPFDECRYEPCVKRRAALAADEPGLDVVIYGEGPKCLNRDHPAALHSHDESGGIVPRWSRP